MLKKIVKKLSRSLGIDLKRYNIQTSEAAKMQRLLAYHNIDLVFDVGTNIGQYAKLLRELGYSGRIVSFEPRSSAYSQSIPNSFVSFLPRIARSISSERSQKPLLASFLARLSPCQKMGKCKVESKLLL